VIPLAAPSFDEREARAVAEVIEAAWLTMGPRTERFETAFAEMTGTAHAVMVSSATAALHLTFLALGVGPGDEVIVPSLTFVATANAVAYTGALPVFADIVSPDLPVIDPDHVRSLTGPRTAAVCAVHYAGYLAPMDALAELAADRGLALVEDAAHAPGAGTPGRIAGSLGAAGCFSFFSNKNLVTGEGGMITTSDGDLARRARLLRAHGMTATSWDRRRGHASGYDVVERGFNYRPSELEAALGLVQLDKMPELTRRRRALVAGYRDLVGAHPGIGTIPFAGLDDASACHILPLVTPGPEDRERARARAAAAAVQTSVHYQPVHRFSVFGQQPPLPRTEHYAEREVTLPLYPDLRPDEVRRVVGALAGGGAPG
jgi:dTDP-4-amino-4,6-dideoxygalactose transaminase